MSGDCTRQLLGDKQHVRENNSFILSLTDYKRLGDPKNGRMFGYVQFHLDVPQSLRAHSANSLQSTGKFQLESVI